ncbi:MAG: Na(+)-translocating NADH-quinone reductase subunit A [Bacteroidales bacterium]|nr:Na(+)-translocating NADH-quinone reductase subunit A [Candidatus Cryptobacteroides faecihippi]
MSNIIDLKKGLNIPVSGTAALETKKTIVPDVVAVKPSDFKGLFPRLLVKEGDKVLAGSPVLADKQNPDILVTSPVGGTVQEIVRGEKRKLLAVLIKADAAGEAVDFGTGMPANAEAVKETLLKSGLWPFIIQRPYGIIANPAVTPKAVFVSAFSTAPLAADAEYALGGEVDAIQAGVSAVAKIAKVIVCVNDSASAFAKLSDATIYTVNGKKHPAGNVGVQISHISPIKKGETVWTLSLEALAAIGKLIKTGKVDLTRKVAVTGPAAIEPAYVTALPGTPIAALKSFYNSAEAELRFISGDILSGENVGENGYLGFKDNQVTIMKEGREREWFGWAKPFRFNQFSSSMTYFSWLLPKKKYNMDTNVHGGPRAFVLSDVYGKVLPMDLYPVYLVKACLAGDIDKMEKFGIYEVLPEDLALCEFVDPSKNNIQAMIQSGIDLMIKEMA